MFPSTIDRVPSQTDQSINEKIRCRTISNVKHYASAGPEAIQRRLEELDREWDVERCLEANAASAVLVGVALGTLVHRRWYIFPAIVGGFLLQHALEGWCPPLTVFRRWGVRTSYEIDDERFALKALRGDFVGLKRDDEAATAYAAIEAAEK